jgi:MFS family permease
MAFLYPSLMANVVNRVSESERASAMGSLTMFFEVGTIVGGVVLGAVGEIASKRAGFLGGGVAALIGIAVLWQLVSPTPVGDDIEVAVEPRATTAAAGTTTTAPAAATTLPACDPA